MFLIVALISGLATDQVDAHSMYPSSKSYLSIASAFHLMSARNDLFSVCNLCTIIFYVAILIDTYLLIGVFKWKMKSRMNLMGKKNEIHSVKETRLVRSVIAVSVFYIATSLTRTMYER